MNVPGLPGDRGGRGKLANLGQALHWVGLGAVIALAIVALWKLDRDAIRRSFARADMLLLVLAGCLSILSLAMQAGRWLAIVHPVEHSARPRDAFFSLVAGYAVGMVIPARAADLVRAHLMARRSGASMATLTATTFLDHLLGAVSLFGALGVFAVVSPVPSWLRSAGLISCGGALAALFALWLLRPQGSPPVQAASSLVPNNAGSRTGIASPPQARGVAVPSAAVPEDSPVAVPENFVVAVPEDPVSQELQTVPGNGRGIRGLLQRLRQGLTAVGQPRALAWALVFALGGWMAELLIAHMALRAFGLPYGVEASMLVLLATTFAAAASVAPGNAGAFQIACIVALSSLDVAREPALAFGVGYHVVHLIPTALVGGGWLLASGYRAAWVRDSIRDS